MLSLSRMLHVKVAMALAKTSHINANVWLYKHTIYIKCNIDGVEESSES